MPMDTETLEKTELKVPVPHNVLLKQTRQGEANASLRPDVIMAILKNVFSKNDGDAMKLTEELFETGKCIANTYTKEVANAKKDEANTALGKYGQDVRAEVEPSAV